MLILIAPSTLIVVLIAPSTLIVVVLITPIALIVVVLIAPIALIVVIGVLVVLVSGLIPYAHVYFTCRFSFVGQRDVLCI